MNILVIDVGTFSIKFMEAQVERKSIVYETCKEVLIRSVVDQLPPDLTLEDIQKEIIASFLNNESYAGKIVYQVPNHLITSRYLELPITNRKKAIQLIPYQLEENLPFSVNNAHYVYQIHKSAKGFFSQINICKQKNFENFYLDLRKRNILPAMMTSELFYYQNFVEEEGLNTTFCILDLGHNTTKAYFSMNGHILANHISHIAGDEITDTISKTYQISYEEAEIYKHDNCFFLTSQQYEEVSAEQKDFALMMQKIFTPLIQEIKRWELGFRVQNAAKIEKIYITGGTSKIHNIDNFLAQSLEMKVEYLDVFNLSKRTNLPIDKKDRPGFTLAQLMIAAQTAKNPLPNFLKGNFSSNFSQTISLHSAIFIAIRTFVIAIVLLFFFTAERIFLVIKSGNLDTSILKLTRSPILELNNTDRRLATLSPGSLVTQFGNKNLKLTQEVESIGSTLTLNAFSALAQLSQMLKPGPEVSMVSFKSDGTNISAKFAGSNIDDVNKLLTAVNDLRLSETVIEHKDGDTHFTLNYKSQ